MVSAPSVFDIRDLSLRDGTTEYPAVIITPVAPMVVGRERIAKLRGANDVNQVERDLISQVLGRPHVRVVLFRAKNDQRQRVWQFHTELDPGELEDAGVVMTQALLPLHRRLVAGGVMLMVHTDWGARECHAMRHGAKVMARRRAPSSATNPRDALDRWLLSNMLLHVDLGLAHVTKSLLPAHLALIDRRWSRVRDLVAQVPAAAVD